MLLRPLQRPLAVADCLCPFRRVAGPLSLLNFLNGVIGNLPGLGPSGWGTYRQRDESWSTRGVRQC
jgi:hypothetical protein